jgi:hypothetical protein
MGGLSPMMPKRAAPSRGLASEGAVSRVASALARSRVRSAFLTTTRTSFWSKG